MTHSLYEMTSCEICGNNNLRSVINLGYHPMCDDLVPVGDERRCKLYPVEILFCDTCITAYQRYQIPKAELFPSSYHYRSRHTSDVLDGMKDLVKACIDTLGTMSGRKVLDVGCNDGSLLSVFAKEGAIETFGIEPTGAACDARASGHTVYEEFLTEDLAKAFVACHGSPDIITFTNSFAHIEDLPAVIRSIKILAHNDTAIVIENHYLGAVIDRGQFDTFYHEHPRTYSYTSFLRIASSLGRQIDVAQFPKRYGGNIRVILRSLGQSDIYHSVSTSIMEKESGFGDALLKLGRAIEAWKSKKGIELEETATQYGPLTAKAFPGRSAISLKLLGVNNLVISAVFEKPGSSKIGHYVPGTRIPIKSDDELKVEAINGPIVNLAWHIAEEIHSYMRDLGYKGSFIEIISNTDFLVS